MKPRAERDALVLSCLRLAHKLAGTAWKQNPASQSFTSLEDFHQHAMLALLKAAEGFKPELGFRFTTYATHCIRHQLVRFAKTQCTVWVPDYVGKKERAEVFSRVRSITGERDFDLPERTASDPSLTLNMSDQMEAVYASMRFLSAKRRNVISQRYLTPNGMTLEQIGAELGRSKEAVRQVEKAAIERMREAIG